MDDVHHVFRQQRLKIEPVRRVKVRRDRLRVVVDDDHLVPRLLERPDAVDGGIVELDALADADWARSKHDHAGLARVVFLQEGLRLVLDTVIVRVKIRRLRLKLRRAGVDHAIARVEVFLHGLPADTGEYLVGIAELLTFEIGFVC